MTTSSSNKKASGRNLLCRQRQGGHGSHGQKSTQESFVLPFGILEEREQTSKDLFFDLPYRSHLAGEVSLDPGDCPRIWRGQYRWPSPVPEGFSQEDPTPPRGKSASNQPQGAGGPFVFYPRRHLLSPERKEDRRPGYSPLGRRLRQRTLCRHQHYQDRDSTLHVGDSGLPAQRRFAQGGFQEQSPNRDRNPLRSHPEDPNPSYCPDGFLRSE